MTKSLLLTKKDVKVLRPDLFIRKYMLAQKVSPAYGYKYETMRFIEDLGVIELADHYRPAEYVVDGQLILSGMTKLVEITTSTGFKVFTVHGNHLNRLLKPSHELKVKNYRLVLLNTAKGEVFFNVVTPETFSAINKHIRLKKETNSRKK